MASVRGFSLAKIVRITVEFSCFDNTVASARELLNRVTSTRMRNTNPKCQVTSVIKGDYTPPYIGVTFSDGSKMQFNPQHHTVLSIVSSLNSKTKTLE